MIKLITDSGCDLTEDIISKYDISILNVNVSYKDTFYYADLSWPYFSKEDFINYIREGGLPEINQPSVGDWINQLKQIISKNPDYDFVYLSMSHNLSGAVKSFNIVKKLMSEETDRLNLVETLGAGVTQELTILEVLDSFNEKTTVSDIQNIVEKINTKIRSFAVSESLRQWAFSGRAQGKKDFSYPEGCPFLVNNSEGIIRPAFLGKSMEESLNYFSNYIKDIKLTNGVINYSPYTEIKYIEEFKRIVTSNGITIIKENEQGPLLTAVEGINSIDASFI